ncbi:AP3-complex subunit beta-A [Gossypium australe]|uniref:AP3-complex subunit beta-A n=1 Tax=Gossypium australe TaxID=47621 RepID=A0A5B6V559_9ROSI|nr:AP3-complex subunit beta-A [Gossypium australe]
MASTMVFRFGTDAHLYDDPDDVNIAPLLDSKYDSEKCEALKRLLALVTQVVKNVASQSLELKKLVYLYLLHYAEKHPNEALLSINCFQKDLGDPNPLVRAWALHTMAGIRLHVIAPLVLVVVNRCARDPTVYVRECAANALPKLHDLRLEEQKSTIEEVCLIILFVYSYFCFLIVGILLNDHSPAIIVGAAAAFASVCPFNLSLIRRNYRMLCEILPDVEEWGQIVLIGILLRYVIARHGLVKESIMSSLQCTDNFHSEKDVSDDDFRLAKEFNHSGACDSEFVNMVSRSNEDVKILLYSTSPLLRSNNSAVVLAAACVHWIMAPKEDVKRIIKPLLFILRSFNVSKYVVLCNIQVFAKAMPSLFAPYHEGFFIYSSDSYQVKALKLEILSSIATDSSISSIFKELQVPAVFIRNSLSLLIFAIYSLERGSQSLHCQANLGDLEKRDYIRDPDRRFAAATVAANPLFSEVIPNFAELLTEDLGSRYQEADVLVQAIISIKSIIKQDPPIHEKVIIQLVPSLDSIKVPSVRAMIIWMVGEYSSLGEIIPRMLTTVLKYLAWCFTSEALETKLQILSTVTKVLSGATGEGLSTFKKVFRYLVELAECDSNYDVRDRACFLKKLLSYNFISQGSQGVYILPEKDLHIPEGTRIIMMEAAVYSRTDDHGTSSDPSDNESASDYGSQHSFSGSRSSGHGDDGESSEGNDNADLLLQISYIGNASEDQNGFFHSSPANLGELMSNRSLESWLEEQPGSSNPGMLEQSQVRKSLARISIGDVGKQIKAKSYSLLEPANRNDLKVDYSFSSEISSISHLLVCIEVSFKNCSPETISGIKLVNVESNRASSDNVPTLVPMEEIASLEPGQTTRRIIQVYFHHHLLPLKLALFYDGEKLPVELRPNIGYFVKPLQMGVEAFTDKESRLPGMFEYSRSCTCTDHVEELNKESGDNLSMEDKILAICESLALKMLRNANLCLVSIDMPIAPNQDDASGLRQRFSSEILGSSIPCLITLTVEGKCSDPLNLSIKVNCEETVLGLNLLNRTINFLVEPAILKSFIFLSILRLGVNLWPV